MAERDPPVRAQFTQPVRQISLMLLVITAVACGLYLGRDTILGIVQANLYLNGVIVGVFVLGVLSCFRQVLQLANSVKWIEEFAASVSESSILKVPSLLAPLATLLSTMGARMQLTASSSRSILDSVGQRIDEDREITRYLSNVLIFLGLLGTFYGLATTVPALVETIRSLAPSEGESGAEVFSRLQKGLEAQLGGMGTAFSSSLLGLAGSLVVGLLELFASHGQNRFYRELEEWLSTITRIGFASEEGGNESSSALAGFVDHLAEQLDALRLSLSESEAKRAEMNSELTTAMKSMSVGSSDETNALMQQVIEGQKDLVERLKEGGGDGMDAESRMRLRSIDVQMLRLLEEMSAGRQESTASIRNDLAALTRVINRASQSDR